MSTGNFSENKRKIGPNPVNSASRAKEKILGNSGNPGKSRVFKGEPSPLPGSGAGKSGAYKYSLRREYSKGSTAQFGKKTAETRRRNCAVLPKRKFPGRHRRVKICLHPGAQVLAHRKIYVCGLFALLYQTFRFFGNIPINAAWAAILAAHGLLKNHVIAHSSTHCSVLRAGFAGGAFTPRPLLPPDVERGERSSPASSDSGSKRGTGIHPP